MYGGYLSVLISLSRPTEPIGQLLNCHGFNPDNYGAIAELIGSFIGAEYQSETSLSDITISSMRTAARAVLKYSFLEPQHVESLLPLIVQRAVAYIRMKELLDHADGERRREVPATADTASSHASPDAQPQP